MRKVSALEAYVDDFKEIHVYMANYFYFGMSDFFYLEDQEFNQTPLIIDEIIIEEDYHHYKCSLQNDIVFGCNYVVTSKQGRSTPLIFSNIMKTRRFDERFKYYGNDLGATYSKRGTLFKVWAPSAYDIKLELQGKDLLSYQMSRDAFGVHSIYLEGEYDNTNYLYIVSVNGCIHRCVDPYAKMLSINSKYSVVIDVENCKLPKIATAPMSSMCDAIVYEASIRDFSNAQTFLGFVEEEGYTFVKQLGVTHIQLLPVLDFKGVNDLDSKASYNWGYDSEAFMALENSYSSDVKTPSQAMKDFSTLVQTCHRDGLKVNVDVVFNHVVDVGRNALQLLVPHYYFQVNEEGFFSNATLCGNDFDSTRFMSSKLIVDACVSLIELYDIDGIRFDLMGILDTETLNEVAKRTRQLKLDFMLYGEGWNMPSLLDESKRASIQNNAKMSHIGHFSDLFRDTIRGNILDNPGYMAGNTTLLHQAMNVLCGSVGDFGYRKQYEDIDHVVNFVECHDNMTLWDQLCLDTSNGKQVNIKKQKLMIASVLLAQGIPFLHAGQEYCRTKHGVQDSYNSPDELNHMDYDRRQEFIEVVEYTKQLIQMRKRYPSFRLPNVLEIYQNIHFENIDEKVLVYHLMSDELKVFFNPSPTIFHYDFAQESEVLFQDGIMQNTYIKQLEIPAYSMIICKMNGEV